MNGFGQRVAACRARVEAALDRWLPPAAVAPARLHEALRYAVLGGPGRVRPLLVYATGEMLGLEVERCDALAVAVEIINAYSLVHDDLPAMADGHLRRGRPATHVAYDEATALLVGDALQALAFEVLATDPALAASAAQRLALIRMLAGASGSRGMVGGQALALPGEGRQLDASEIEHIHQLRTGSLIQAAILLPAQLSGTLGTKQVGALAIFAARIGLVFQIRDDLLEIEPTTRGPGGPEIRNRQATIPAVLGEAAARARADSLYTEAIDALDAFGGAAERLCWLASFMLERSR